MAKATPDAVLDKMADYIIAQATQQIACSGQPANFAGIAAVALADVTIDSTDFSKANGDVSGRKFTVAQQSGVTIDANGTATHVVLASASELLYVTTCASQVLNAGGTVTFPAWDVEVADPA